MASNTGTPAWALMKLMRSLRSLMIVPAISTASLPLPTDTTLADWLALGSKDAMPISVIVGIVAMAGWRLISKSSFKTSINSLAISNRRASTQR